MGRPFYFGSEILSVLFKKATIKKNSGLDISFGSFNKFGLNVFGLTVLYCNNNNFAVRPIRTRSQRVNTDM